MKLHEAKHIGASPFKGLMNSFFKRVSSDWEDTGYDDTFDDLFDHIWIPKLTVFPWYTEMDPRGPDYSVDEQIAWIGQDPKNEDQIWVEYDLEKRANGDWMDKDHFMKHVHINDEQGRRIAPL